ncbi:MAG: hypothetical protein AAGD14_15375 [Planctomycetota bacterium]
MERTSAAPRYEPPAADRKQDVAAPQTKRAASAPRIVRTQPTWRATLAAFENWPHDLPEKKLQRILRDSLAATDKPVERQYLIFLAVRMLSADAAKSLLAELTDPADAEDVLVALAFNGDGAAIEGFAELAQRPSHAAVAHLVDELPDIERIEQMANEDARAILRSYRALEVLTRDFYFHAVNAWSRVPYQSNWDRAPRKRLLPLWLDRYPGHPGSDDVAVWLAIAEHGIDACRWYARAASLPDQRRTSKALRGLAYEAENHCTIEELEALIEEGGPQPVLLHYTRIRRIAAERGYRAGLDAARAYAAAYPSSSIAYAWRDRHGTQGPEWQPAAGEGWPVQLGHLHDSVAVQRSPGDRLSPPREAMTLDARLLAHQFGCWEKLARTNARLATARLLIENPYALYPVYAKRSHWSTRFLFRAKVHGYRLADLEGIRGPEPAFLRARIAEEPFRITSDEILVENLGRTEARRKAAHLADRFDRVAEFFPDSPFAARAIVRADYWRSKDFP